MEYRSLGKSDIKISPIIMGTWQAGTKGWPGTEDSECARAIKAAYDGGINTFDTASAYGKGHSERLVGKALANKRDQVVLATKVVPQRLKHDQVIQACHTSLRNLNTDYIDLYQIHWPAGSFGTLKVPIEETMSAMLKLREQGKIRTIGVSNFSSVELKEAMQFGRIDSIQPPYSLFWRHVESDSAPVCIDGKISILAYSPLAQGLLTGKFKPNHPFEEGDNRLGNKLFQPEHSQRVETALERLCSLANNKNITAGQLSLAWLIAQPNTSAVVGARNAEQVRQNALAATVRLSEDELREIDQAGRTVTDHLDNDPVLWK